MIGIEILGIIRAFSRVPEGTPEVIEPRAEVIFKVEALRATSILL